jgi:carboxyl-terminal processing protease
MKKKISVGASIVLVLLAALLTFQVTFTVMSVKHREEMTAAYAHLESFNKLLEVDAMYRNLYVKDLDEDELIDGILAGYVMGSGDRFGAYYPAEEFQTYMDSLNGDMQGIGVNVIWSADYGAIEIINVMPDSPALEAGVEPGDLIVYVGDEMESVADLGYYGALAKLQGKAGTTAVFTVARGKHYEETVSFSILRGYVTEQTVMYHVYALDSTVGVVKITGFDRATPDQFFHAVQTLLAGGCTRLVVDVRNNPGGELQAICSVLDYLLPSGPVIRTVDRDGNEEVVYYSDAKALDVPMAVLVNENTASAGELFCSALQDYDKAVIVGTQTYGKGSMQTIRQLSDGSGLSVTYRYYCPPFSDNYDGVGVAPDVVVEPAGAMLEKNIYKITDEEDNQLQAAVAELNK